MASSFKLCDRWECDHLHSLAAETAAGTDAIGVSVGLGSSLDAGEKSNLDDRSIHPIYLSLFSTSCVLSST
jgi:hypothetical protein